MLNVTFNNIENTPNQSQIKSKATPKQTNKPRTQTVQTRPKHKRVFSHTDAKNLHETRLRQEEKLTQIIIDANFILVPLQFKIDIFENIANLLNQQFEPILLSTTLQEIQKMAEKGPPKLSKQATMALKIAEKCHIISVEKSQGETNDDVILRMATQWKIPVATNDRELRKKLRARSIPVIFLRGKHRLELEGAP